MTLKELSYGFDILQWVLVNQNNKIATLENTPPLHPPPWLWYIYGWTYPPESVKITQKELSYGFEIFMNQNGLQILYWSA